MKTKFFWKTLLNVAVLFLLTGCGTNMNSVEKSDAQTQETLCVTFFNTGKSDAVLIEMDGLVLLNDTADANDYYLISDSLMEKGISSIDYLILSHFDKDHIGSADRILKNYTVKYVVMPEYMEDSSLFTNFLSILEEHKTETIILTGERNVISAKNGTVVINSSKESSYENENNYSLITKINYGEHMLLLTGDALKQRLAEFMESEDMPESVDVIKLPHHGDYTKALRTLLEKTSPDYGIITEGREKSRVEDKLIDALTELNIPYFFTYDGTVTVTSDGSKLSCQQ